MFTKDPTSENGIHLINLDSRYHSSPNFSNYSPCEGSGSTILGENQWSRLAKKLKKSSDIKVIGNGIQVLPPTYYEGGIEKFCSYSGDNSNRDIFLGANSALGKGSGVSGTSYESWDQIPQERTRLLHMCQESIHAGKKKDHLHIWQSALG